MGYAHYYVYRITSPTGHVYVGITQNPYRRFKAYRHKQCKAQAAIYNSIVKYGWEAHRVEIVESVACDTSEISRLERQWIAYERSKGTCLNILDGGSGYNKRQNRKKRAIQQYTIDGAFVREWPSLTAAALAVGGTDNAGINISVVARGRGHYAYGFRWKFADDPNPFAIRPMVWGGSKTVAKLDSNGRVIDTYSSASNAAKANGIEPLRMYGYLKPSSRRQGKQLEGYYWKYVSDEITTAQSPP